METRGIVSRIAMNWQANDLAQRLDQLLGVEGHPDYPGALNGLQVEHRGPVVKLAAAVDASQKTIEGAASAGANFLIVHHGLFWGGPQRVVGHTYGRFRKLFEHDIALYSVHLPLDAHPTFGNNVLLASELSLSPSAPFASYQGRPIGVLGEVDVPTADLVARADAFARRHGGLAFASAVPIGHHTRRWAICTGAGASTDTLREAEQAGVDTLIAGEGPHHTAVEAPERGVVIIYAGHYATETLGVSAVTGHLAGDTGLPWIFIDSPTGL